jgi:hypothetical protein
MAMIIETTLVYPAAVHGSDLPPTILFSFCFLIFSFALLRALFVFFVTFVVRSRILK